MISLTDCRYPLDGAREVGYCGIDTKARQEMACRVGDVVEI
ncbi:MAG: hypothetical protein AB1609_10035 [Bacillota bacterium]